MPNWSSTSEKSVSHIWQSHAMLLYNIGIWYFPIISLEGVSTLGSVWGITNVEEIWFKSVTVGKVIFHYSSCPLIYIGIKNDQLSLQACILKTKDPIGHSRQCWIEVLKKYYSHVHLLSQTGLARSRSSWILSGVILRVPYTRRWMCERGEVVSMLNIDVADPLGNPRDFLLVWLC